MHLIGYNSFNKLRTGSPSQTLLSLTRIEKDQYTLIEQSEYCVVFNVAITNSTELAILYNNIANVIIAVHDAFTIM